MNNYLNRVLDIYENEYKNGRKNPEYWLYDRMMIYLCEFPTIELATKLWLMQMLYSYNWWAILGEFYKKGKYDLLLFFLDKTIKTPETEIVPELNYDLNRIISKYYKENTINIDSFGYTLLIACSCNYDNTEANVKLIDKITDLPNIQKLFNTATVGYRCVLNAIDANNIDILKILLSKRVKIDSQVFLNYKKSDGEDIIKLLRNYIDTIGEISVNLADGVYGSLIKGDISHKLYFDKNLIVNSISPENIELLKKYNYRFDNHRKLNENIDEYHKIITQACEIDRNLSLY